MSDVPLCWRDPLGDGGPSLLANAAVPEEVQDALAPRMGRTAGAAGTAGTAGDSSDFQNLLEALVSPPSSVCIRYTGAGVTGVTGGYGPTEEVSIKAGLWESEKRTQCAFLIKEVPPPIHCPEARLIVGNAHASSYCTPHHPTKFSGVDDEKDEKVGFNSSQGNVECADGKKDEVSDIADFIIDATCAMAVLRGSDVFCMGVMAASPKPLEGQLVRLWVVPEGVRPPNRGSVLRESPSKWPAVLVAGGRLLVPRSAIFGAGCKGAAVEVLWRRGSTTPLAPMNQVLHGLQGKILLQQLPSCVCTRVLQPMVGHRVLDMCAAPGGKTTHIAQLLGNSGLGLTSVDRSLAKVRRIEALCMAHGFGNVRCLAADSRHLCSDSTKSESQGNNQIDESISEGQNSSSLSPWPPEAETAFQQALAQHGADRFRSSKRIWKAVVAAVGRGPVTRMQVNERLRTVEGRLGVPQHDSPGGPPFLENSFDRILLDPPCSAMGQRPLLRWGKSLAEIQSHAEYQRQFLCTASRLLMPGGELVYSTCTLTPQENEENVAWALSNLPLRLLDAREHVATATEVLAGLPECGLSQHQTMQVLRFDPRNWDAGFFIARFAKVRQDLDKMKSVQEKVRGVEMGHQFLGFAIGSVWYRYIISFMKCVF